jgi:hypothetical protein
LVRREQVEPAAREAPPVTAAAYIQAMNAERQQVKGPLATRAELERQLQLPARPTQLHTL